MILCERVPAPCSENDAETFDCIHCRFYSDFTIGQLHGYCFNSRDQCDYKSMKEETNEREMGY